jgi:hypothetical protein
MAVPRRKTMAEKTLQVGGYHRTIRQRVVTYPCQDCGRTDTVLRYPGPTPRYCAYCKELVERWRRLTDRPAAAARMWRLREQRRAATPPH